MPLRLSAAVANTLIFLVAACSNASRQEDASADTTSQRSPVLSCAPLLWQGGADTSRGARRQVTRHIVNGGTHGMFAHVRWTLSADRCSMLVVEDPVSIEADPLPNGFLLVSERLHALLQRDNVWDAAPSPDWNRLAYSRAFRLPQFGTEDSIIVDSLLRPEWQRLGARIGLEPGVVRRSAFSCSGMTTLYCLAQLHVADLTQLTERLAVTRDTVRALPVLAGWRIRWTADGSTLLAGIPRGSQDQAPPTGWLVVDPSTASVRDTVSTADTAGIARTTWSEGPVLSYDVALDLASRSELAIDGAAVVSEGGWIAVSWPGPSGTPTSFRVGVGRALAATRGGRFIAAVVPARTSPTQTWAYELVVYEVSP